MGIALSVNQDGRKAKQSSCFDLRLLFLVLFCAYLIVVSTQTSTKRWKDKTI